MKNVADSTPKQLFVERRKHERFQAKDGTFASLCDKFAVLGQIMNISHGGLAFSYVSSRLRSQESPALHIASTDRTFYLRMIPFSSVWDRPIPQAYSLGHITLRQCGVQFDGLTDEQKFDLKWFVKNYTSPPEKPRE